MISSSLQILDRRCCFLISFFSLFLIWMKNMFCFVFKKNNKTHLKLRYRNKYIIFSLSNFNIIQNTLLIFIENIAYLKVILNFFFIFTNMMCIKRNILSKGKMSCGKFTSLWYKAECIDHLVRMKLTIHS